MIFPVKSDCAFTSYFSPVDRFRIISKINDGKTTSFYAFLAKVPQVLEWVRLFGEIDFFAKTYSSSLPFPNQGTGIICLFMPSNVIYFSPY